MGSAMRGFLSAAKTGYPTNATTAIIKRNCFMPATLRLTGSGVNAVGGEITGRLLMMFITVSVFSILSHDFSRTAMLSDEKTNPLS